MQSISVIVPTLNEEEAMAEFLECVRALAPDLEIIVVDGGSTDGTVDEAEPHARVVRTGRGRGKQMNAGASESSGDVLWFLHADCRPHPDSVGAIRLALADPAVVGGGFEFGLDHPGIFFRITTTVSNRKNRALKLLFGDMGIFVRSEVFEEMDGYRDIPLMEDVDFCERLKERGEIVIVPVRLESSARRWFEEGILYNLVRNWVLQLAWKCGASPDTLAKWYSFGNEKRGTTR